MKIIYLVTKSELGGAQTNVLQLSKYFISKGHDVYVLGGPGEWLGKEIKKIGGKFILNANFSNSYDPFKLLMGYFQIRKVIEKIDPDLVHCHSSISALLGRLAIRGKIPTVYTAHGWGFNVGVPLIQKWLAILAEKIVSKYTRALICVSDFVKDLALRYRIIEESKISLVYNGVSIFIKSEKSLSDSINIVFIGRLERPKLPLLLVNALESISVRWTLKIIGSGSQSVTLKEAIERKKLSNVALLGSLPHEQTLDILSTADLLAFPSEWEGFPYAILEAMAQEVPVIASDVGGISEMVNEETGYLVKDNTLETWIAILRLVFNEKDTLQYKGKKAQEIVLEKFNEERMLKETERIYKEILKIV